MSLFYVYMRWVRPKHNRSGDWSRQLLTCESRYVADEFFRALQTLRSSKGSGPKRFVLLERDTPQFWLYDTIDSSPWESIRDILNQDGDRLPESVQGRIMSTLLHNGPGREWPVAPVIVGLDWRHNRTYFIRNIRQPNLYWFHGRGDQILISERQRTRFSVGMKDNEGKVLIRSDVIRISIPPEGQNQTRYVGTNNNRLVASQGAKDWLFGDLLSKFGTSWQLWCGVLDEYVTWSENGGLDQWELC